MDIPTVRYGQIDPEYFETLAGTPAEDDGPVWMINLMKYRDLADYQDGRETTITGREADDIYAPFGPLAAVGAEIVFVADVETQLLGDAPVWDRVAVVKYPTRRSFIDMQSDPSFLDLHVHKEAGMEQTIVMGGLAMETPAIPDAPDWADVPHPPTADDGPVVVLHVIRFVDGGIDDMTALPEPAPRPSRCRTACAWPDGSRSKARSSATVARGIRRASTPSRVARRSWRSSSTRTGWPRSTVTGNRRWPTPTR